MESMPLQDFFKIHSTLNEDEIILDVRTPAEFQEGHIPGSKNINHEDVTQHLDELKQYKKIYIFCRRGGRAQVATSMLAQHGLTNMICIPDAGMDVWREHGYPVEN